MTKKWLLVGMLGLSILAGCGDNIEKKESVFESQYVKMVCLESSQSGAYAIYMDEMTGNLYFRGSSGITPLYAENGKTVKNINDFN